MEVTETLCLKSVFALDWTTDGLEQLMTGLSRPHSLKDLVALLGLGFHQTCLDLGKQFYWEDMVVKSRF